MKRAKIGVVGCGAISGAYLGAGKTFPIIEVVACSDLDMEKARARAEEFGIPRACTLDELLADPDIETVVNLTIPSAHAEIAIASLKAGKNAYSEKPFAVHRLDGKKILETASQLGLRVGCAPDTFLGAGFQTCRRVLDEGWIGEPIGATAFMLCHGHESWHPNPEFYYQPGGGPMFDMGPYYLTALVHLLGPARRVTASTRITFPERQITSQPKYGKIVDVEVPTHIAGVLDFARGAIGTIVTSFDVWAANTPVIEIYGTEGTLSCPDPNGFGGPVRVRRPGGEWHEVPLLRPEAHRGIGLADLSHAIRLNREHRVSGRLAYHVLDIMEAFHDASREGRHIELGSSCERPAPLPVTLDVNELE